MRTWAYAKSRLGTGFVEQDLLFARVSVSPISEGYVNTTDTTTHPDLRFPHERQQD